jgi:carbamoyltransferase
LVILGINPGYDSTAALLIDGKVKAIVEEERLSRVKLHLGFPRRAIKEVLRIANISPHEVDKVTFSFNDYLKANPLITKLLLSDKGFPFDPENPIQPIDILKKILQTLELREIFNLSYVKASQKNFKKNYDAYLTEFSNLGFKIDSITQVDHHLSHAASAYYGSKFGKCLIVTADGSGDGLSSTISIGENGKIQRLYQTPENSSPGQFYASITSFLGFKAHRHEGKITGLAAFGDPAKCNAILQPCLGLNEDRTSFTCDFTDDSLLNRIKHLPKLAKQKYFRHPVANNYHEYYKKTLSKFSREDIAAATQKHLEDVFIDMIQPLIKKLNLDKISLAGGVFGNVKLNQRILEIEGVNNIYIHPNMGDGGNALGSAWFHHAKELEKNNQEPFLGEKLNHVYLGASYSNELIEKELKSQNVKYKYYDSIEPIIAENIANGIIVGRFNGGMEYGPRALGNRSILASPKESSINDVLNKRLRRTEFMPFAPSVIEEDVQTFFDISKKSSYAAEFMTITCNIHSDKRNLIPAVCHIDGTARPHIVRKEINPSYHKIISEFKKITGIGLIVNTSFNIHEEPIVCTPDDACRAFKQKAIDILAIGNFIVEH